MPGPGLVRAGLLTLIFSLFLWLSWSGQLDQLADDQLQPAFKKALLTLAAARGLNSVISVAQGTEIALQPAGVGVTLSAGQILDPLNDLIERFSWLVLLATASLGVQITLTEIFSNPTVNLAFSAIASLCLICVWLCRTRLPLFSQNVRLSAYATRLASAVMLTRFALAIVTFVAGLLSQFFLEQKQTESLLILQHTSGVLEEQVHETPPINAGGSLLDIFSAFLEEQKNTLDMEARITELKTRVESAISHIINLIVLYLLQTLIIPIAILYLFQKIIRATWTSLTPQSAQNG